MHGKFLPRWHMKYAMCCVVLVLLMIQSSALAQQPAALPSITTTGTATVHALPDRAVIYVGFSETDKEIAKARKLNQADAEKLIKVVKDAGVAEKDISTERMSVSPHYADRENRIQDGFTASRGY